MTVIRPALNEDRTAWAAMRAALWPDAPPTEHATGIAMALAGEDLLCLVAEEAGKAIGFVEASIRRDPVNGCETSPVGFLEGLYVRPDYRRAGVARALLAGVERWVAARGCSELGSDAEAGNVMGHAFHLGAGFEERERLVFYRRLI